MLVCIFASKFQSLRNDALVNAAFIFPGVAALHAVVITAAHVDGAVDMDIYGALQLCTMGILVAPMTIKSSNTHFTASGRNLVLFWTGLMLAGMALCPVTNTLKPSHAKQSYMQGWYA